MKLLIEIILFISFISEFLLGLFVYLKGRHKQVNRYFYALMMSCAFWSIFLAFAIIFISNFLIKASIVFGLFGSTFFMLFSYAFSEYRKKVGLKLLLGVILPLVILSPLMLFTRLIIGDTIFYPNGFINPADGQAGVIFYIYHLFYSAAGFYLLFRGYKLATGIRKMHFQYLFAGLALLLAIFIITNIILPIFGIYHFITLSSSSFLILAFFFLYIISRYRLMDIRIVIRKGIIYAFSLIIALALYTYLALILKSTIEKSWNISPAWTAFILVGLVAVGFPPLKSLIERLVNAIFKGKQSIDLAVKELQEKIAKRKDLDALTDLITEEIKKYLEIKEAKIYIIDRKEQQFVYSNAEEEREALSLSSDLVRYFEKYSDTLVRDEIEHLLEEQQGKFEKEILHKAEREMKKHKFTLALPLKTEDEIFGIIALGERQNSQTYTVQDVQFLEQLREQVNFTLANAILYRDTVARVRQIYGGNA